MERHLPSEITQCYVPPRQNVVSDAIQIYTGSVWRDTAGWSSLQRRLPATRHRWTCPVL